MTAILIAIPIAVSAILAGMFAGKLFIALQKDQSERQIDIDYRARLYIECQGNLYRIIVSNKTAWIVRQATANSADGPNICFDIVEAEVMPYDAQSEAWNWSGVYTLIAAYELYRAKNDSDAQDAEKSPDTPNPPTTLTNHLTFRRGFANEN